MPTFLENILSAIGNTPMVRLGHVIGPRGPTVLAKLEFLNPGGSIKDRIGIAMIRKAIKDGKLQKGGTVVEPSSGNTGVGLALACVLMGFKLIVTMPDKMSEEKHRLLKAYGAKVILCPTSVSPDDPRNYINVARKLAEETPDAFFPNQYFNEENVRAHYSTTGPEIWSQTDGKINCLVCGMGTGGTITGSGRFLKEKNKDIKIVGVDPEGSAFYDLFYGRKVDATRVYAIEGIGEDFLPGTTDLSVIDEIVKVSDKEAYSMSRRLASEEALLVGSSSGAAVAGLIKILDRFKQKDTIVVVLPDRGERYLTKLFNDTWMRAKGFLV